MKTYVRICPKCKKEIHHKTRQSRWYSKDKLCRSCVKLGQSPWNKGIPWGEETRKKQSEAAKKRSQFPDERKRLKQIRQLRNNAISLETRGKISLAHRKRLCKINNHPNYNKQACQLFEQINNELGWHGQHAENGGEFHIKELGYWVDYYEPTQNIVIEYDETNHQYQQERDFRRQREIETYLKCRFYRIRSGEDWKTIL